MLNMEYRSIGLKVWNKTPLQIIMESLLTGFPLSLKYLFSLYFNFFPDLSFALNLVQILDASQKVMD